ncbi:ShlB/FhaC/HecB family hemolysin secretion/activation protein [Thalassospira tepidiphila]|uniref:ShlB/FhaC/HecB family hemolysin secretion/activation protein n=1 Tax=Thalassospira tepidiphila TaxID=393657 RepID=UPI003AA9DB62
MNSNAVKCGRQTEQPIRKFNRINSSVRRNFVRRCIWGGGLLFACMSFATAQAQTPSQRDEIIRQQQQLLRQDEERRREIEQQRKLRELTPPEEDEESPKEVAPSDGQCILIDQISLSKNDVISSGDIPEILEDFEGRCLTTTDLEQLLAAVNDALRGSGFITTRAYLQPQELANQVLEITIVEGRIEDILLGDNTTEDKTQLSFAFPNSSGDLLNIRDIEQGLDQMNRLRSNNAKMQVSPGTQAGLSVVNVTNEATRPYRFTFGRDNSGSSSTGKLQNTAAMTADNVLSINDAWSLNYSKTARDFGSATLSESLSGVLSVPIGYSTLTYSGSYYRYSTLVSGDTQDFMTSGLSTSHKFEISHIIHRDQTSKTRLDLSLTTKRSRNYIEDVLVNTSSRDLVVGRTAIAHSARLLGGIGSIELGFEKGLKILGALEDQPDQESDAPKAQFRKWDLDVNYQHPFQIGQQAFSLSTSTRWQYTPDTLFGTERIGIGGQYSVRGFRDDTLSGDIGGYVRNELVWSSAAAAFGLPDNILNNVQPYGAFDWGWIKRDNSEAREKGTLRGVALGIRAYGKYVSLSAEYAHGMSSPDFLEKNGHEINFRAVFHL